MPEVSRVTRVTCPMCQSTEVDGVLVPAQYSGVLYWACDDCGLRWNRFSPEMDEGLHRLAATMMRRYE